MLSKNQLKYILQLHTKKGRAESGLFIAEGVKIVEELLVSDFTVKEVVCTSVPALSERAEKTMLVSETELEKISGLVTPNEVLALVEIPQWELDVKTLESKLTLVLDDIQDPGNMGTIIRIADWFGIENIICSPNTVDCFNPKVVQSTMGSIARVKVHYVVLDQFLVELKAANKDGFKIYGAVLEGTTIYNAKIEPKGLIVIGNESKGISTNVESMLTDKISIPNFSHLKLGRGEVESLNAAVATAIICAEFRRVTAGK